MKWWDVRDSSNILWLLEGGSSKWTQVEGVKFVEHVNKGTIFWLFWEEGEGQIIIHDHWGEGGGLEGSKIWTQDISTANKRSATHLCNYSSFNKLGQVLISYVLFKMHNASGDSKFWFSEWFQVPKHPLTDIHTLKLK